MPDMLAERSKTVPSVDPRVPNNGPRGSRSLGQKQVKRGAVMSRKALVAPSCQARRKVKRKSTEQTFMIISSSLVRADWIDKVDVLALDVRYSLDLLYQSL